MGVKMFCMHFPYPVPSSGGTAVLNTAFQTAEVFMYPLVFLCDAELVGNGTCAAFKLSFADNLDFS